MDKKICFYAVEHDRNDALMHGVRVMGFDSNVRDCVFFRDVAKAIAFGDCTDEEVVQIVWQGKEVKYDGWRRGMYFGFSDCETGKCVYGASFPEYDH